MWPRSEVVEPADCESALSGCKFHRSPHYRMSTALKFSMLRTRSLGSNPSIRRNDGSETAKASTKIGEVSDS